MMKGLGLLFVMVMVNALPRPPQLPQPPQPADRCIGDCKCPPGKEGHQPFCWLKPEVAAEKEKCMEEKEGNGETEGLEDWNTNCRNTNYLLKRMNETAEMTTGPIRKSKGEIKWVEEEEVNHLPTELTSLAILRHNQQNIMIRYTAQRNTSEEAMGISLSMITKR